MIERVKSDEERLEALRAEMLEMAVDFGEKAGGYDNRRLWAAYDAIARKEKEERRLMKKLGIGGRRA